MTRSQYRFAAMVLIAAALHSSTARAAMTPPAAPALPAPTGHVVTVSTVSQLQSAVAALGSDTTILIQPGTYKLTQQLRIRYGVTNVALRGATNNRNDVVILGSGMTVAGVDIAIKVENAQDVLLANFSVGQARFHPIQLQGEQGAERVHIYNVRLFDAGQQFLKSTFDVNNPDGVDGVVVEYSLFEFTAMGPAYGYTQGIDVHNGAGWIIRYNTFRNITVPSTATYKQRPAIDMWSGSRDTLVYGNLIVNCERGIILGLGPQSGFEHSHSGGAVFNNVIYRAAGKTVNPDAGISIWDSPGTRVFNNTVIQNGTYKDAIEYRFPGTTGVQVYNNLTDGAIRSRDNAVATVANNYTLATPALFANAAAADLHLTAAAAVAIDRGRAVAGTTVDFDRQARPTGSAWDIGADEFVRPSGLGVPTLFLPQSGQQNVAIAALLNGVTGTYLRWKAVAGATRYDVYFGTASTPPKVVTLTVSGTSCSPVSCVSTTFPGTFYWAAPASPGATYYWRIVASNASGSASGAVWSFSTVP